jgi:hypothetical protein
MMTFDINLAMNIAIGVLLLATIVQCFRLDRKLMQLRKGQDGMREAAAELVDSIQRAEAAVRGLRAASDDAKRDLQQRIDEARGLAGRMADLRGRAALPETDDRPFQRPVSRVPAAPAAQPSAPLRGRQSGAEFDPWQ